MSSDSARPLGSMILLIVGVLVALAIFWVGFMLAPAAVLLISYFALSAGERGRHQRQPDVNPLELTNGSVRAARADRDRQGDDPRGERVQRGWDGQAEDGQSREDGITHSAENQPRGVRA
jgi:hypothetical protein